jgi:indole-3-glycerol phosphate synthase
MSDVLAEICAEKRAHVARRKAARPEAALRTDLTAAPPLRSFATALEARVTEGRYGLIAEIKKASPSKGLIRADFDPPTLAQAYEAGGATCLSVLTDAPYFQGGDEYLRAARAACALPVLRKDFILDPYQVLESRAIGADCILLIMAALDDGMARELAALAAELGLDVLVEVHDRAELDRALRLDARLIGINNRDLKTLKVDLRTAENLAPLVPPGRVIVGESGINDATDLDRLAAVGARCFLVGESLMRAGDVAAATRRLLRLPDLTHIDVEGRARMVDVSDKDETDRVAIAGARVEMRPETLARIQAGDIAKGDVLATARLAGIMAAKRTADLIPLCHPLALTKVTIDIDTDAKLPGCIVRSTVKVTGPTGVEMEALTAVSVACLTIYDMIKAVERGVRIEGIHLIEKIGGKSGHFRAGA